MIDGTGLPDPIQLKTVFKVDNIDEIVPVLWTVGNNMLKKLNDLSNNETKSLEQKIDKLRDNLDEIENNNN